MRKGEAEREEEAPVYLLFMGFMAEPNLLPWSRASGPAGAAAAAATEVPSSVAQATKTSTVSMTLYRRSVNCKSVHLLPGIWIL